MEESVQTNVRKLHQMNTKTVATIAVFSALAIALNLSPFKIPAPFAPFLIYQIWEIPIVAAFLLFGTGKIICTGARDIKDIQAALVKFKGKLKDAGVKVGAG